MKNKIESIQKLFYPMDIKNEISGGRNQTFYRRKELYWLEYYEYDENDPYDLLNVLDLINRDL